MYSKTFFFFFFKGKRLSVLFKKGRVNAKGKILKQDKVGVVKIRFQV